MIPSGLVPSAAMVLMLLEAVVLTLLEAVVLTLSNVMVYDVQARSRPCCISTRVIRDSVQHGIGCQAAGPDVDFQVVRADGTLLQCALGSRDAGCWIVHLCPSWWWLQLVAAGLDLGIQRYPPQGSTT